MWPELWQVDEGTRSLKGHGLPAGAVEGLLGVCVALLALEEIVVDNAAANAPLVEKMQILLFWLQP